MSARRYGSNIPRARDRLLMLAGLLDKDDPVSRSQIARAIRAIVADDMHQKKQLRPRGCYRSDRSVSEAEWAEVRRKYFIERLPQQKIAEAMDIAAGRISEHLSRWAPEKEEAA